MRNVNKHTIYKISLLLLIFCATTIFSKAKQVSLVSEKSLMEQAVILKTYLETIYINDSFVFTKKSLPTGDAIIFKIDKKLREEQFIIGSEEQEDRVILTLSAKSTAGMYYAVFQLLEKLGWGFFLSFETTPNHRAEIQLSGINFSDKPLSKERIVFNWHNFLSGCSSWDLNEWKHYIDLTSKMRFNGLMTHFYANDPTFIFSHNGIEKEAGYMPNTTNGRQYGTQQVNDITRMAAGDRFENKVFGSKTSKVPDTGRVDSAMKLMQNIHSYASSKFMDVWFGYDIDYELANPQEIMATLPERAKIKVKRKPNKYFGMPDSVFYLPIPDSPEGHAYYKSQIMQLFQQFPEIDNLVLWSRTSGSAFLTISYDEFPEKWKSEFDEMIVQNNKLNKSDKNITGRFATSKIFGAIKKCLKELDKSDIKLWAGSWRTSWIEQADWFYPKDVGFIPLDYFNDYFSVIAKHEILKKISRSRKIIPIVWAHHDDGEFIGSPLIPYENLQEKIQSVGNTGVGIIHWTTNPLDIYFKNTEEQIWESTANASLTKTSEFMAKRLVKEENEQVFSKYFENWITEGPKFGRETRTWFIDAEISVLEYQRVLKDCRKRISVLESIDEPSNKHVQYFIALEEFYIDFYKTQFLYQKALNKCQSGNYSAAKVLLEVCNPEKVIEKYAIASSINGLTLGEKGVIVEMNLSWLPLINSLKQTLGDAPVLYNFGKVNFPHLGVGLLNTNYFLDREKRLWRNYSSAEVGGDYFTNNKVDIESEKEVLREICYSGIQSQDSIVINIKPIGSDISPNDLKNPDYFSPGRYKLSLIFNEHEFAKKGERIFDLSIADKNNNKYITKEKIDLVRLANGKNKVLIESYNIDLNKNSLLTVRLKSIQGGCLINGLKLELFE